MYKIVQRALVFAACKCACAVCRAGGTDVLTQPTQASSRQFCKDGGWNNPNALSGNASITLQEGDLRNSPLCIIYPPVTSHHRPLSLLSIKARPHSHSLLKYSYTLVLDLVSVLGHSVFQSSRTPAPYVLACLELRLYISIVGGKE